VTALSQAVFWAVVTPAAAALFDVASAGMSTAFNVGITAGALLGSHVLAGADVRSSALLRALISGVALISALAECRFTGPLLPQPCKAFERLGVAVPRNDAHEVTTRSL
jgi:predicted MFS family arabinose efflux permease